MYYSIQWSKQTQDIPVCIDIDGTIDHYDINHDFKKLVNNQCNINTIRTRIWIDGYHISPHSKQFGASLVHCYFTYLW